jgi:hypothetical protein
MQTVALSRRVFRIHRRADGRYKSRNENPTDGPLGVDTSLSLAIDTATREAVLASQEGQSVLIEVLQPNGIWKEVGVVKPS